MQESFDKRDLVIGEVGSYGGCVLFTIGHSTHTQGRFLELLRLYEVDVVADVRIVPMSSYAPQFCQDELCTFLQANGVRYIYCGDAFGARQVDCVNEEGQVDFERVREGARFQGGVQTLLSLLDQGHHIALMCAEAAPLKCHRFALVARYFHEHGFDVRHILPEGDCTTHRELEDKMLHQYSRSRKYHLQEVDLLYSYEEQLRDAYRLKNKEIGYRI